MKLTLLILLLFYFTNSFSQVWGDSSVLKQNIFYSVEHSPRFGDGVKDYYKFIADNLSLDQESAIALMKNIVTVRLVISSSGKVVYAEITKGVNEICDNAVLNLISKMPPWIPGKQNGKHVACFITLPILVM